MDLFINEEDINPPSRQIKSEIYVKQNTSKNQTYQKSNTYDIYRGKYDISSPLIQERRATTMNQSTSLTHIDRSYLISMVEGRGNSRREIGMAIISINGYELVLSQFVDTSSYFRLFTLLNLYPPSEIIIPHTLLNNEVPEELVMLIEEKYGNKILMGVHRKFFNEKLGLDLISMLKCNNQNCFELESNSKYYCLAASSALFKYIEMAYDVTFSPSCLKVSFHSTEKVVFIDSSTASLLELTHNLVHESESKNLFDSLNRTITAGGARLLRSSLLQPSTDINAINKRYDFIHELNNNELGYTELVNVLKKSVFLDRLIASFIHLNKSYLQKYSEMRISSIIYLKHTLEIIPNLIQLVEGIKCSLMEEMKKDFLDPSFDSLNDILATIIHDDTRVATGVLNMRTQKVFTIKPNVNGMLDVARRTYVESIDDISEMINQLSEKHSLRIKPSFNSSRGFFGQIAIEAGEEGLRHLPSEFIKCTKTKKGISFTTVDLMKLNARVNESLNEISYLTNEIIGSVMISIRKHIFCLYKLSENIAILDMLQCFTTLSIAYKLTRPIFSDKTEIIDAAHPLLLISNGSKKDPVLNDISLTCFKNISIITGPNMSGKSTYLKTAGLIQIMAQMGCYIPCSRGKLKSISQIFTRMANYDDFEKNVSTFTMEMKEISYILQNYNDDSLILIDELGRGTSYFEGASIAISILEHLKNSKSFVLFATHFKELCNLEYIWNNLVNFHFNENSMPNVKSSYKLSHGAFYGQNYGITLAEKLIFPFEIITEAKQISESIQNKYRNKVNSVDKYQRMEFLSIFINKLRSLFNKNLCTEEQKLEICRLKTIFMEKYYE